MRDVPSTGGGPPRFLHRRVHLTGGVFACAASLSPVPPRPRIPEELTAEPFTGRSAVQQGLLTSKQLRSSCWVRLLRNVYVHRDLVVDDGVRLRALRLVVRPGRVVIGRTAAWLHGVWRPLPDAVVPLEVSDVRPSGGETVAGMSRRRLTVRTARFDPTGVSALDGDVVDLDGLRVLSPWRTCFDLMRERALVEAVVVADAFAYAGAIDLVTMAVYASERVRWPQVRVTRTALNLASAWARSPGESRLRMVVVLGGLPEPFVNVPLMDAGGRLLGIPDLTVVGPRRSVGLEYDGAYHELDEQRGADLRRENGIAAVGGLPLLRYDRWSVRNDRELILREVARTCGLTPRAELEHADFRRPPPPLAW